MSFSEKTINEKQKLINKLVNENILLKHRLLTVENYINNFQGQLLLKKHEIINEANKNANLIISQAINAAYNFKIELEQLWLNLEGKKTDPDALLKIIDDFLEKHATTFLVNSDLSHQIFVNLEEKINSFT